MIKYSDIEKLIQDDIKYLNQLLSTRLNSDIVLINQISSYIINSGGKRIRPLIVILLCNALNYKGQFKYIMAAIIELIHTATLLHDDVVDESNMRRGKDTSNQKWGNAAAVLVGDFLYSRAFEMMIEPNNMQIMQILSKATNNIAQGEVMQLLNCGRTDLTEAEYFTTIQRKTACLFEAASLTAGILSTKIKLPKLANFGINLGNAFQIIDDILDYKADTKIIGKEIGDDLSEGKITIPLIYTVNNANPADKKVLINAIQNKDISRIEQIIQILDKNNAFEYALQKAIISANNAKKNIDFLPNNKYKKALIGLCQLSLDRKS